MRYARTANTVLDGVYDSPTGSVTGPWNKIADSQKLASSGSALRGSAVFVFPSSGSPGPPLRLSS